MLLGSRMIKFIREKNRIPKLDDENPHAQSLANEWALSAAFGDAETDKLEYYQALSREKLLERCNRIIDSSNMPETIQRVMNTVIQNGISLLIRNAFNKTNERVNSFLSRFKLTLTPEAIQRTQVPIENDIHKLVEEQRKLKAALQEKLKIFMNDVDRQAEDARRDLKEFRENGITKQNPRPTRLIHYLQNYVGGIQESQIRSLIFQVNPVTFNSKESVEAARDELAKQFKVAIRTFLWMNNMHVVGEAIGWCREEKKAIEERVTLLGNQFASFHIHMKKENELVPLELPEIQTQEAVLEFEIKLQQATARTTLWSYLKSFVITPQPSERENSGNSRVVEPIPLRDKLLEYSEKILQASVKATKDSVENAVNEILQQFVVSVEDEMSRLAAELEEYKRLTINKQNEMIQQALVEAERALESLKNLNSSLSF